MKGAVINYRKLKLKNGFKGPQFVVLLGIIYIIGIWIGSHLVYQLGDSLMTNYKTIIEEYISLRQSGRFSDILRSSIGGNLLYVLVLFLCGFSALSLPVIISTPFIKGMGYAFITVGILNINQGITPIILATLTGSVITTLPLFFCGAQSYNLSKGILKGYRSSQGHSANTTVKQYFIRYFFLTLVIIIGVILESLLLVIIRGLSL